MIASVSGRVAAVSPQAAVVEVGGVGLLVHCTPGTLAGLVVGEEASLATALVVRENEMTLYGFADADERDVFEALQSATGVGPRLAQAVLGVHSPDAVRRAVADEDLATLTKVPGIGRKGAQRIVLDLKDRLGRPSAVAVGLGGSAAIAPTPAGPGGALAQVRSALIGLGYTATEAEAAVAALESAGAGGGRDGDGPNADSSQGGDVSTLLRQALALLRPT